MQILTSGFVCLRNDPDAEAPYFTITPGMILPVDWATNLLYDKLDDPKAVEVNDLDKIQTAVEHSYYMMYLRQIALEPAILEVLGAYGAVPGQRALGGILGKSREHVSKTLASMDKRGIPIKREYGRVWM